MTTYNGEKFLHQQIDSILNQSYTDFELIICDDKSNDNTVKIIQSYMEKHTHIKLYQNTDRLGSVKNFEKVIGLCHGKYIALSDQDDIWEENKLEEQIDEMRKIEKLDHMSPIMIHSDLMMINEKNITIQNSYFKFRKYRLKDNKDLGHILGPCGVMGNTLLFNNILKEKILPFPNNLDTHDYWIAVINELVGKRVTIHKPLVKYMIHTDNLSNNIKNIAQEKSFLTILKKYIQRKVTIPYVNSNRKYIIEYILDNYHIHKDDILTLMHFKKYLEQDGSKIVLIYYMLSHSIIKRDLIYRFKYIIKFLVKK